MPPPASPASAGAGFAGAGVTSVSVVGVGVGDVGGARRPRDRVGIQRQRAGTVRLRSGQQPARDRDAVLNRDVRVRRDRADELEPVFRGVELPTCQKTLQA
jgi:hypothetical protein